MVRIVTKAEQARRNAPDAAGGCGCISILVGVLVISGVMPITFSGEKLGAVGNMVAGVVILAIGVLALVYYFRNQ
jgi:hypothetical protein